MAELLVSVRSVAEAEAALTGGAAIIDVKEPRFGSLGRAADSTIAGVIGFLKGRVPASAALGELARTPRPLACPGLTYAKWGLAGCGPHWRQKLELAARQQMRCAPGCRIVAVAYADWRLAQAPSPAEIFEFVGRLGWQIVLIDTWRKNGRTLLDWISPSEVERYCHGCRQAGIRVALAGSLGPREIRSLLVAEPDFFAVRGAVCRQNNREQSIDPVKIRHLVDQLAESATRCGN
jgi:(5-formylfuran-3-yl)methyl phosphate synthase